MPGFRAKSIAVHDRFLSHGLLTSSVGDRPLVLDGEMRAYTSGEIAVVCRRQGVTVWIAAPSGPPWVVKMASETRQSPEAWIFARLECATGPLVYC